MSKSLKDVLFEHGLRYDGQPKVGGDVVWEMPAWFMDDVLVGYCSIGAYSYIARRSSVLHAHLGRFCSVGQDVKFVTGEHPLDWVSTHPFSYQVVFPHWQKSSPPAAISELWTRRSRGGQ